MPIEIKYKYISISSPSAWRYRDNKKLDLTTFLPSVNKESEIEQFTQFIEDYLNTMFDGEDGMTQEASIIQTFGDYSLDGVSGTLVPYQYVNPMFAAYISADRTDVEQIEISQSSDASNKISTIEKVHRLTELKDPDLIDIEYIQYFAANMGYNIDVYRSEVGNIGSDLGIYDERAQYSNSATSASDVNKYLRFMVSNLPNWYKIKATDSAVKVMLYSFGLVGDLIKYYTSNYLEPSNGGQWKADYEGDLSQIPKNYFITPHFALRIYVDSSSDLITDTSKRASVIRAIQSIQPINTVFRNLSGYVSRSFHTQVQMDVRLSRYIRIE
jgi:hypothetical protein